MKRSVAYLVMAAILLLNVGMQSTHGDELIYGYEGNVLPYSPPCGWAIFNPCVGVCQEHVEDGRFVATWSGVGDFYYHAKWISHEGEEPPPSLWIEWRFRSNHPLGQFFYSCDAFFVIQFRSIGGLVNMYGDAVFSFSADTAMTGLELGEFHSFRFESFDGESFHIWIDGALLVSEAGNTSNTVTIIEIGGNGGCDNDQVPNPRNEWDFVRYGTIGFGERIVASDPPIGFLYPGEHANLDRFTVTYDSPNYAYIDDITVSVMCATAPNCPPAPVVVATKRLDNGPPDVLEIVLDRPLPANARTVFTFTDVDPANPDEPTINTVSYTFQLGDVNADGQWKLLDFASMQNCFYQLANSNTCAAFDFSGDIFVDLTDFPLFSMHAFP